MLRYLIPGGTFLLASPYDETEVWDKIPAQVQQQIIDKKAKFYVVDAVSLANLVETRKYGDRAAILWVLDEIGPDGMGEVDFKPLVAGEKVLDKIKDVIIKNQINSSV